MKNMPGIPEAAQTEEKARAFLESQRFVDGAYCPKCGDMDVYRMKNTKTDGKRPARKGLWRCRGCKKQFTVTCGTIFEGSHIPLHKWLLAFHFMTASKKGISSLQLHRMLGITRKSAWFMSHRIRHAMTPANQEKLDGIVEVDETYVGGLGKNAHGKHCPQKTVVMALIKRDGDAIAHSIPDASTKTLRKALLKSVDRNATVITDAWPQYRKATYGFKQHFAVAHERKEYARKADWGIITSNTAESFFAILKRGVMGTFHHVSAKHMDRYANEFAFRWNTRKGSDYARTLEAIKGTEGKRLVYKSTL